MTTINNIADLVRILREQPEWADAVRSILLSQELLDLPERFAKFVQRVDQKFEAIDQRFDDLTQDMNTRFDGMDARFNRLEGQVGNLAGYVYEQKVRNAALVRARNVLGLQDPNWP